VPPFAPQSSAPSSAIAGALAAVTDAVTSALGARLAALLLVGSYARGEGGVVERRGALHPYNDFDLVAVVRGGGRGLRSRLAAIGHAWTARLGVDVDIYPVGAPALASPPPTLFWLDVALGGVRVLAGDERLLDAVRRLRPRDVPLEEAARLLANRAVGLALSNLERAPADRTRPQRHVHKAALAVGDALLLAADRYQPTVAARAEALRGLAGAPRVGPALVARYEDAARFRLRPERWAPPAGEPLDLWLAAAVADLGRRHLAFERLRAGAPSDVAAFAAWSGRLYPRLSDVRPGGALLASLRAAARAEAPLLPWTGHPRERLARVAVALAYGGADPRARREAERLLGTPGANPGGDERLRRALGSLLLVGG